MKKHFSSILLAGILWGTTGVFRRLLDSIGLNTISVVFIRSLIALICFTVTLLIRDRNAFKIKLKDLWCFIGTGLVSFLLFTLCYFKAMTLMSLSTAAILLYSAPCFVILISIPCFHEKINAAKIIALVLAFAGCCLVSGIGSGENHLSALGILCGLGSGICYALYSIFSRFALNRGYSSLTINFYTSLLATLGALCLGGWQSLPECFSSSSAVLISVSTGIVTCFLPYMLYTYGLTGVENGKASIIASIEPVVATLMGILIFGESLSLMSLCGIVLVLSAIVITNLRTSKE
ncbi:MAG: DMT family transporter [Treponema sp.]|nr:DMT family transporter [Treponema sp.]